jgi:hypothetical protein
MHSIHEKNDLHTCVMSSTHLCVDACLEHVRWAYKLCAQLIKAYIAGSISVCSACLCVAHRQVVNHYMCSSMFIRSSRRV